MNGEGKKDKKDFRLEDISKPEGQWTHVDNEDLMPLPAPLDTLEAEPEWRRIPEEVREKFECGLDDTLILNIPKPESKEEEEKLVRKFLDGLAKLFSKEDNWPFLRPLALSMEHCAQCQTCSKACHIYEASGFNPVYRPTCRSEVLRRIYYKYIKPGGNVMNRWRHGDIDPARGSTRSSGLP